MANTIGLECKAYLGSGTFASPTWVEMSSVIEVTMSLSRTLAILKARATTWERGLPGLLKGEVKFKLLRDNANVQQIALQALLFSGGMGLLAFADGPIATPGTTYLKGEYVVGQFEEGEPLEEGATIDVSAMPHGKSTNNPVFTTVA
jgi:hypothetical protein